MDISSQRLQRSLHTRDKLSIPGKENIDYAGGIKLWSERF